MRAAVQPGPVFGSALFVSPRRPVAAAKHKRARAKRAAASATQVRYTRRPIGLGRRAILVTNPACKATPRVVRAKPVMRRAARRTPLYAGLAGSLLFSAAAFGLSFAVDTPRTLMARSDYVSARQAIESDARAAFGRCRAEPSSGRDVCRAEVRANERVAKADLDARYHGTVAAANDAKLARARARFEVARARCNALESGERLQCLQAARAEEAHGTAARRAAT
jgi:hypothetical protein